MSRSTTAAFQSAHSSPRSSRAHTARTSFSAESTLKQHWVRRPSNSEVIHGRAAMSTWVEAMSIGQMRLSARRTKSAFPSVAGRAGEKQNALGRANDVDGRRARLEHGERCGLDANVGPADVVDVPVDEDLNRTKVRLGAVLEAAGAERPSVAELALDVAQELADVLGDAEDVGLVASDGGSGACRGRAAAQASDVAEEGERQAVLVEEAVGSSGGGSRRLGDRARRLRGADDERVGLRYETMGA